MRRTLLAIAIHMLLVVSLSSCEQDASGTTQIVVSLRADASVASSLTRIDVQTYDPDALGDMLNISAAQGRSFVLDQGSAGSMPVTLPFSFGIQKNRLLRFLLIVRGYTGEALSIEQKVLLSFTPGESRGVQIYLGGACYQRLCTRETADDWFRTTCYPERIQACGEIEERETEPVTPGKELQTVPSYVEREGGIGPEDAASTSSEDGAAIDELITDGGESVSAFDSGLAMDAMPNVASDGAVASDAGSSDARVIDAGDAGARDGGGAVDAGARDASVEAGAPTCASLTCSSNATCSATGGAHCVCNTGFQANASGGCDNIDDCRNNPCGAGNTCLDAVNDYSCVCASSRFQADAKRCVPKFAGVAVGLSHACALRTDGSVHCWGDNTNGVAGLDTQGLTLVPTALGWISNAVAIAAGGRHSCAVLSDGMVWCWGRGDEGQLGNGTRGSAIAHAPAVGISNAVAVAAGVGHTCALLRSGGVSCWGDAQFVGGGTSENFAAAPVAVPGINNATAIAAGDSHTCVLRSDGTVACWGRGGYCGTVSATPVAASGWLQIEQLAAGDGFTCGKRSNGSVVCCGGNFYGQLGNGSTTGATSPTDVSSLSSVASIGAGVAHACAVRADGALTCWGKDDQGQLGNGVYDNSTLPTALFGGMKGFVSVRAGEMMTCALRSDGNLSCFGGRFLGNGQAATSSPAPVTVTAY